MAVLFVSHSKKDDNAAAGLETWLREHGFTDLFIDHSNIIGGEKWAQALRNAAGACRVIICLVTEHWLASDECFGEFKAAWYMGKRIIPLLALQRGNPPFADRLAKVLAEDQGFDIVSCINTQGQLDLGSDAQIEHRLEAGLRAVGALTRVGLDPEAFEIDRNLRPTPFPGLASFGDDDADAALFYGRTREIAEVLEEMRKVRAERDLRPFVILGASGAGKSSLLKAGIIPRLRREAPAWLPLRAFRPGADPLLNFAEALARTMADFSKIEAYGVIRDRLFATWVNAERENKELTPGGSAALEAALEAEGSKLRSMADRAGATILVSIDQAEELARADSDDAEALADYLQTALSSATSPWQLAFTIRSDSFPELQKHRRFQSLKARGYDLRAVPIFHFESVVGEPAKRYGVQIDEDLVSTLINDAPAEDALPLLAFALQRLWHRYATAASISKDNYASVGGLRQLIEDAAERALRGIAPEQDVPLPSGPTPQQRVELATATFVPGLAQLNERGAIVSRPAPWRDFLEEQQQLLTSFDQWRLVVRKATEAEGGTVEVAHEALFREWARLKSWLEPERARLEGLRSLQVDALVWDRNDRDTSFINHRDKRLTELRSLAEIERYRRRLDATDLAYLEACEQHSRKAQQRQRRVQVLIGTLAMVLVVGFGAWWQQNWLKQSIFVWRNVNVLTAAQETALKPGDPPFRECTDCPEMVVVPAGSFIMGPLPEVDYNDAPRHSVSKPKQPSAGAHKVAIAKPFAVAKFELTFNEWDACWAQGGCVHAVDHGFGRGRQPVINVNWYEAKQYVTWLSRITGKTYRLLSEAEYEHAARAGTTTVYPWGDDVKLDGKAMANCVGCGSGFEGIKPAPVGSFLPNKFGLYDMVGNVSEWTEDCNHTTGDGYETYDGAPTDGSPWIGPDDCSWRVVRGGSWNSGSAGSTDRSADYSLYGLDYLGFRVARMLTP